MPLTEKGNEILSNMKKEYGPEKGESVFYASKNKGTISGVDSMSVHDVPIGACYGKDQSYPSMDPTSIGGMGPTEPSTLAPSGVDAGAHADADPNRLRFASHEAVNPVERRRAERERAEREHLVNPTHGAEAARRAGPLGPEKPGSGEAGSGRDQQPSGGTKAQFMKLAEAAHHMWVETAKTGNKEMANHYHQQSVEYLRKASEAKDQHPSEPGHEAKEMSLVHQLEKMHDYSGDAASPAGNLPKTFTQEQMSTMASMFNYNPKGSPY